MIQTIHPMGSSFSLRGSLQVPGDKSISHRALIFGALAEGETEVRNLLRGGDVHSTWNALEALGISIQESQQDPTRVRVLGRDLRSWTRPQSALNCGNSGTTMRLLMGVLSAAPFGVELTGDDSLMRRPMKRVADPLRQMGAQIRLSQAGTAPVFIDPASGPLRGLDFSLPVASAQLKSALLLAGALANGSTCLRGALLSRDHTERMLPQFGVQMEEREDELRIQGGQRFKPACVEVPGDFSSAAFWLAAAALVPGSQLELQGVSLNPTRMGFLNVLQRMGARFDLQMHRMRPEPIGDIRIQFSSLQGTEVEPHEIASLVDEVPLLAVLGALAQGVTQVRGAQELRVKETDRLSAVEHHIRAMGGSMEVFEDGFQIQGPQRLQGAVLESRGDHRIAMAFSIAALRAESVTEIHDTDCVAISYPGFFEDLRRLRGEGS
ncbi:MAG: 3-phosphoshikimate 1-carboxyvinyltransferase [Bdellovibrionia bacterium]